MPDASSSYIPDWARPIRIPADIPILHPIPETATAGEKGSWRLRFRLHRDVPAEWDLFLQIAGGRNNKGPFRGLIIPHNDSNGNVSASDGNGNPIGIAEGPSGGTLALDRRNKLLQKGTEITVQIGSHDTPCQATDIRMLNKMFILYCPQLLDASSWELPDTFLSGKGTGSTIIAATGSTWTPHTGACIVAVCTMHILGDETEHIKAYIPSNCCLDTPVPVLVRPEDRRCNLAPLRPGQISVYFRGKKLPSISIPVKHSTCLKISTSLPAPGIHRLVVRDENTGLETITNPTICRRSYDGSKTFWGMIHGHTEMSDGTGTLHEYFRQMRDEALIDIAAPGDHDHIEETPDAYWERICDSVVEWNEPGRMVTFPGYEWAKWRKNGDGDRNVYFQHDHPRIYRSENDIFPHPPDLFKALRDANERALIIPHHPGHGGNFCDWKDHDPERERLVEIFQIRGSYEMVEDNPLPEKVDIPSFPGGYVSEALKAGWRVGFTAGGDDHMGHAGTDFPTSGQDGAYKAGLTAVLAEDLDRKAVWEALWNRRTVATSGARILLDYTVNGHGFGSEHRADHEPQLFAERRIRVEYHGTAPVQRVDIIRNSAVLHTVLPDRTDGEFEWVDTEHLDKLLIRNSKFREEPFCYYYVRILQHDREMAWASPVWIDAPDHS